MATFSSDKVATNLPTREIHAGAYVEVAFYSGSASFSSGDVIQMAKVPAGARVVDLHVQTNTLSDSASATLSIGDGLDPNRYASVGGTSTIQTGLENRLTAVGYEYTANDTVDITVSDAGGDPTAAPVVHAYITMVVDN